ncbi:hypothetical protein B0I32_14028 [Nonomuraea fuscirosea]|uniref:Uncharacterized protein n=1 Tax=Nonomuraea fuscirosea TaxID=1291556 RepID=A0A2T0LXN3_9ACTN|nr:hypothetical protein B0I32_14028 [Nonomuraea fuscirosea]
MPGTLIVGLYETPDRTLIWKLDGQVVGGMHALSPGRAVIERGGPDRPLIDMAATQRSSLHPLIGGVR